MQGACRNCRSEKPGHFRFATGGMNRFDAGRSKTLHGTAKWLFDPMPVAAGLSEYPG
jgi:hypothetical protein